MLFLFAFNIEHLDIKLHDLSPKKIIRNQTGISNNSLAIQNADKPDSQKHPSHKPLGQLPPGLKSLQSRRGLAASPGLALTPRTEHSSDSCCHKLVPMPSSKLENRKQQKNKHNLSDLLSPQQLQHRCFY